jgi:hypothetical protein
MNPNLKDQNDPDPMLIFEAEFSRRSPGAEHQSPYLLKQEMRGTLGGLRHAAARYIHGRDFLER